jgi:DNA-binding beta-propeller fold protein YncE
MGLGVRSSGIFSLRRIAFPFLTILIALVLGRSSVAQTAHPGATLPIGSGFILPNAVAVDSSGNVFVADPGNNAVKEIEAVGGVVSSSSAVNTIGSGFNQPSGVAVDAIGNVFVGDSGNNAVKEIVAVGGVVSSSSAVNTIGSGFNQPSGVAVDAIGDVFVADSGNNAVKEIVAVGGAVSSSSAVNTIGSGFNQPSGVAVDAIGNVFVADPGNNAVKEIVAVGGVVSSSSTVSTIGSGFIVPAAVAVDSAGNVFVADNGDGVVKKIIAVGGVISSSSTVTAIGSGFSMPISVAVDSTDNVFVADPGNNAVKEIVAASQKLPTIAVGNASAAFSIPFTFDAGGSIGVPAVLTQGAVGLDFVDAGTGSCTTNGTSFSYSAGDTCTVDVMFTPKLSGQRNGAVVLYDGSGTPIATGYVYGTATGPQVTFSPGTQSLVANGFNLPKGVAVDGSDNVYIADNNNGTVLKQTLSGGSYAPSSVASGLTGPNGVAIDGSGNIYITEEGSGNVYRETLSDGVYTQSTVVSGLNDPTSLVVDGSGNVYITEAGTGNVYKETLSGSTYTQSTVVGGLNNPDGVAVDGSGNVYITEAGTGNVYKETLFSGTYTQSTVVSGLNNPDGVAVDGSGNLYILDGSGIVYKEALSGGSYTQSLIASGLSFPQGVAVDGSGNVYISYLGAASANSVIKEDLADAPSLSFATATIAGSTDTMDGALTVTIANNGNSALSFPIPASGSNPAISTNFTLDSASIGTCPLTGSISSTAGMLAAGTSCTLQISFAPTTAGSINGSLVLTNTNLNANPSTTQTISLSGTGVQGLDHFTLTSVPTTATAGTSFNVTVTAYSSTDNTTLASSYVGPITFTSTDANAVFPTTLTLTNGTGTFAITLQTAGSQTIKAGDPISSTNATSSSIVVSATSASSVIALAGGGQSAVIGAAFATALQVKVVDIYSNPVSGATVTISAPGSGVSATPSSPTCSTAADGTCSVTATANGIASSTAYSVSASVSGVSTPATFSLTNNQASTTIATIPTATSIIYGQPVTLNASITPTVAGGSAPGGSVTFYDGTSTALTPNSPVASAAASYTVPVPSVATHTYYAKYLGDTNFVASAQAPAASTVAVGKATSTLAGPGATTVLAHGITGNISILITGQYSGMGISTPSGTISYAINDSSNATQASGTPVVSGGSVTIPVPGTLAPGNYAVAVSYAGDGNYNAATPINAALQIQQITPTVSFTAPSTAIIYGAMLGVTATANEGSTTVSGTMSYTAQKAGGSAVTVDATTVLAAGSYTLTATFTPADTTIYTSASAQTNLTVTQATPTTNWSNPSAISYGTALSAAQLNASATGSNSASLDGTYTYTPASGTVLSVGANQTLSVTFSPNDSTNYAVATKSVSIDVNPASQAISFTTPASPITYGSATTVPLTATGGASGNAVTFTATGPAAITESTLAITGAGAIIVTANQAGNSNYKAATAVQQTITVGKASVALSAQPVFVAYGQGSSIQVTITGQYSGTAIALPSGSVSYTILNSASTSVASGTLTIASGAVTVPVATNLAPGSYMVSVIYGGDTNYSASASATTIQLQVGQIQPVVAIATPGSSLTYGTALGISATATSNSNSVAGSFTYTATPASGSASEVTATTVLPVGTYSLTASFTPTDMVSYKTATTTSSLTVNKATAGVALGSSVNPILVQNSTTLTATVSSTTGTPTGSVTFLDSSSSTPLGTVALGGGVAALPVSTLAVGTHSITAVYSGDTNFLTATSAAVSEQVNDFSLNFPTGSGSGSGSTTATIAPGGTATYSLNLAPVGMTTFPAPVTLSVSDLPPGATATITPQVLPAGSSLTNVTLTVQLSKTTALLHRGERLTPVSLALLLLPFSRRIRRRAGRLGRLVAMLLLFVAGAAGVAGMTGCGSAGDSSGQPQSYTITITGTSGTLSHSTTVTLNVQ